MRIGTRGSALALAQARAVADLIEGDVEVVTVTTSGDRDRAGLDKEKWVKELELALIEREIDLAVHSAKDVPAQLPQGLELVGAPARADPRDALCGATSLEELAPGARVGTSSLRRASQLLALRDDLDVAELRGNVDTRLVKLAGGDYDAIVVALAGLQRLGRDDVVGAALDIVPAAGQGTLALEARSGDEAVREAVAAITDTDTLACLSAERAVVRVLGADCHSAVGAHASRAADGRLRLRAFVGAADGSAWLRDELEGDEPEELGAQVAARLLAVGAAELLS